MSTAARLDLRLVDHDKERIAKAAALRGVSISTFVREVALREADAAIAASTAVTLSAEESRRFLATLDAPFQPNARLQRAMDQASRASRR
jgi:Uncharacterized protein conserved in bacteria